MGEERSMVCEPCKHLCLCDQCALQLSLSGHILSKKTDVLNLNYFLLGLLKCPICRLAHEIVLKLMKFRLVRFVGDKFIHLRRYRYYLSLQRTPLKLLVLVLPNPEIVVLMFNFFCFSLAISNCCKCFLFDGVILTVKKLVPVRSTEGNSLTRP